MGIVKTLKEFLEDNLTSVFKVENDNPTSSVEYHSGKTVVDALNMRESLHRLVAFGENMWRKHLDEMVLLLGDESEVLIVHDDETAHTGIFLERDADEYE